MDPPPIRVREPVCMTCGHGRDLHRRRPAGTDAVADPGQAGCVGCAERWEQKGGGQQGAAVVCAGFVEESAY